MGSYQLCENLRDRHECRKVPNLRNTLKILVEPNSGGKMADRLVYAFLQFHE